MQHNTSWPKYLGIFLIALATLAFELLLTRVFSVTMWYHFAFMAISVALFGMTAGAILVYQLPKIFRPKSAHGQMAIASAGFAVAVLGAFLTYLAIPYKAGSGPWDNYLLPLIFTVIAIPFVFSGVAITIALTKFPAAVSRLYAADLVGAALGCLVVVFMLDYADAQTGMIAVAAGGFLAAACFALGSGRRGLVLGTGLASVLAAALVLLNTYMVYHQQGLIKLRWVKGGLETAVADPFKYERWTSFSRIRVTGDPNQVDRPWGWGLSDRLPEDHLVNQLHVTIDAAAGTAITKWDGVDQAPIEHLKWDVTNVAHWLRDDARVLVVGVGGGRDVLASVAFGQQHVTGVEMNGRIIKTISNPKVLGNWTGFADHENDPRFDFVIDEARSYLARTEDQFDILMVSLIDTWAATAAGAFVFSENSLHTIDSWEIFLNRLKPGGILTFTRWHAKAAPNEIYRLLTLATASLQRIGVENPRDHLMIVLKYPFVYKGEVDERFGVATVLTSNAPFTEQDITRIKSVCEEKGFELILYPEGDSDPVLARIASGDNLPEFLRSHPLNLAPPTDDSPFFFHMLRPGDFLNRQLIEENELMFNGDAIQILGILLITVVVLSLICIIGPLVLATERGTLTGSLPFFFYFCGIGFGFMLVEIAMIQRLNLFLGHPFYGLSVVLVTFLLFSGIGSFLTDGINAQNMKRSAGLRLAALVVVVLVIGVMTPMILRHLESATTPIRIATAVLLMAPMATLMGMAFPIGMKAAAGRYGDLTPWFWGINGATSVVATVLAVAISLAVSISATFWSGLVMYGLTLAMFLVIASTGRHLPRANGPR